MKDDTRDANSYETGEDLAPSSTKSDGRKKKSKTDTHSDKPSRKKRKSFIRSWKSSGPIARWTLIFGGIGALVGVAYVFEYACSSNQTARIASEQHKPTVVHLHPPALLQPVSCNVENRTFEIGNIRAEIKNIGTATATKIFPQLVEATVVPEKKTGDPSVDNPPPINDETCRAVNGNPPGFPSGTFPLAQGVEVSPQFRQIAISLPSSVRKGDAVQLYYSECVIYSDDSGQHYGTCDTFQLYVPSNNLIDNSQGTPTLVCDGRKYMGIFLKTTTNGCQK